MDPDAVAKAFVEHYYTTFDTNRAGLANLYQDTSMLTFEGQKFQGTQSITGKLTSLPFQQCQHGITTVDCQPSGPAGGMLVFVSGNLQLAGEQHALKFSQATSTGTFFKTPESHVLGPMLFVLFSCVTDDVSFDANTAGQLLCVE
ncbi:UNVERIFIED_CONTAM: Nuclear transport factor 2B [Sesamum radiatum]|uniref:NTF2-related export protein n=1 Tax=Sesamum radiatum TaxID=300843 RepID=A0AAW2MXX8_SESRA